MNLAWENLDAFFVNEAEGGFAFTVTAEATDTDPALEFQGIYDQSFYVREIGEFDLEADRPRLTVKESDTLTVERGRKISLKGKNFEVLENKPDGSGTATLILKETL